MKLWYRCQMCSPDQSVCFDIPWKNPPFLVVLNLVENHHKRTSPECQASNAGLNSVAIELLVRMVQ